MAASLLDVLLAASLAVSVVTDLRERRILNVVTLPALALALLVRAAGGGLASGLLGVATASLPFFLLAWRGAMGMGDVKLMAVVGACVGAERIAPVLLAIALVGGLQGVLALLWTGSLGRTLRRLLLRGAVPQAAAVTLPYGVSIALGTAWVWLGL